MCNKRNVLENFKEYEKYEKGRISSGIEENRKGRVKIFLKDKNGGNAKGAAVKVIQKTHEFKYGANLFMLDELETEEKNARYKTSFKDAFNMATLPFYWSDLEPERGKVRYDKDSVKIYRRPPIDLCIEFCEKNGIEPREHGLAYELYFPEWLKGCGTDEIKREFERRCREISDRYAGKIPTIEVTNEMMWQKGTTHFYNDEDYVRWCFDTASSYFPNNKLVINEGGEGGEGAGIWDIAYRTVSSPYYLMIENTLLKGARIDAVGMQFHMFFRRENEKEATLRYYDPAAIYNILDVYSHFNLPIQITEVTVPAYSNDPEDEELQAEIITRLYKLWFSHPNVEQIIYWNLVDGYAAFAPRGDMTSGENYYYGGLLRFDMSPKPAYFAIKNLFEKVWHTEEELVADNEGVGEFKGFFGKYEVIVEYNGEEKIFEIDVKKNGDNNFILHI